MNKLAILLTLSNVVAVPARGLQARTPQAALEEIATTNKPDVIARHLPEPVQKSIAVLPEAQKQLVFDKLVSLKAEQLEGCTVRRADDVDAWDVMDAEGASKGRVKLVNAFFSGAETLLWLKLESDEATQMFIVAMHLEGEDWRLDSFGAWQNADLGLRKLVHQPTQAEKNEAAALETLAEIASAVYAYAERFPSAGLPSHLNMLAAAAEQEPDEEHAALLDASFAVDPLIKSGYEFRYVLTDRGSETFIGRHIPIILRGKFQITARPVEYGKTGIRSYMINQGGIHNTIENRNAAEEDPAPEDPD